MSWAVRHQGSPRRIENLSVQQVVEGLQDGLWEPTDEVTGPEDAGWTAIEEHPQFAEVVESLEPPEAKVHEDETRLDFNALIDVTLVLLIFFILTTSYQTLEKVMEMPKSSADDPSGVRVVEQERVENFMIMVKARQDSGKPQIWIEEKQVPEERLQAELAKLARQSKKSELLLDASGVDYGTVVKIIDAAAGAHIAQVHFLTRQG